MSNPVTGCIHSIYNAVNSSGFPGRVKNSHLLHHLYMLCNAFALRVLILSALGNSPLKDYSSPMRKQISWTSRTADGAKREVRVSVDSHGAKWQFKRSDEEKWDYDSPATDEDWATLEEVLVRRGQRGRQTNVLEKVRKIRSRNGV